MLLDRSPHTPDLTITRVFVKYIVSPNPEIEIPQPQEIVKAGYNNRTF